MKKNVFDNVTGSHISIAIFFLIILFHLPWINFNGTAVPDTSGYVDVSRHWYASEHIYIRPIIYPFFIFLAKIFHQGEFGILVFIQVILYSFGCAIFYKISLANQNKINKYLLAIIVIISFAAPQTLYSNQIILPEMLPLFFIILLILFLLRPPSFKNSIIMSVLILIPILLKPLWLLLLFFPLIKFFYSKKTYRIFMLGVIVPTIFPILFYGTNQYLVSKSGTNAIAASTFDMNANLSLIRMGQINADTQSELYRFLERKNLISEISGRKWDNSTKEFSRFTYIKNQIPSKYREDPKFWKSILLENPGSLSYYLKFQIKRIPSFFATSAANYNVQFLPNFLERYYQSFYYNIHSKHIVGFSLLLFTFCIGLLRFNIFTLHKLLFFLILGSSLVICLLVYQNPHFLRMRAVIEPLILYISLFTLFKLFVFFKSKINFQLRNQ